MAESSYGGCASEGILRRQSAREPAARTYARALPVVPVRARGLTIEGADGRRYLDCLSGAGTLALGHNHPVVLEAIRKVLDSGAPLHALDLATPVQDAFITELLRTLPPGLAGHARVRFCGPAGTDAVKTAFELVRAATGRPGMLAFTGARLGATAGAPEPSGETSDAHVTRLPYPHDYRCPFGVGGAPGAELAARWTESLLDDPESGVPDLAGMIVEPVQSEGGVIPAPDTWMQRIRQITATRSIPLIADEIHTGVGRTGTFWAVEHSGVIPDVMVLSKAIGGSLPLSVVVYRDDLDACELGAHAGTIRGNQLAMAAGTATLAYVREHGLAERASQLGVRMLSQLRALERRFSCVGDVRGRGLMLGVELVDPEAGGGGDGGGAGFGLGDAGFGWDGGGDAGFGGGECGAVEVNGARCGGGCGCADAGRERCMCGCGEAGGVQRVCGCAEAGGLRCGCRGGQVADSACPGGCAEADAARCGRAERPARRPRPAAPELAAAVQRECLRRGLIVELGGRHASVVRLLPPLTISDEQADAVLDRLSDAVEAVARDHTSHGVAHRPGHERNRHSDHAARAG